MKKKYFLYKIVFFIMIFLLIAGFANAATLSKNIPKNIEPGNMLTVTFGISDIETGEIFSIEEMIVNELPVKDYEIEGAEKTETETDYEKKLSSDGKKTRYNWVYQATASNPKLTYTIDIPSTLEGNYVLDTIYILPPAKMDNIKSNLRIGKVVCGDGYCEGNENSDTCPEDCPKVEKAEAVTAATEEEPTATGGLGAITGAVFGKLFATKGRSLSLDLSIIAVIIIIVVLFLLKKWKKKGKSKKAK